VKAAALTLSSSTHHISVVDENGISSIITQGTLFRYLAEQGPENLGSIVKKTVGELQFGIKPVVSVHPDAIALDAFKLMAEKKIGGVAIVENKKLFSMLS